MDMAESDDNTIGDNYRKGASCCVEKEHMFDKVVTPSDVGKLNRLVIPKQHAEKFFPLDTSDKAALLLNFEDDRNGKSWRFRYSYWSSSQSYVMTKGWSRFVKDKKLDAGDIVSFRRGVGHRGIGRLFIDSEPRPDPIRNNFPYFSFPSFGAPSQLPQTISFLRPLQSHPPLITFSAGPAPNSPKTLRLFGVNMMEAADSDNNSPSSSTYLDLLRPEMITGSDRKGKSSSLDLDL